MGEEEDIFIYLDGVQADKCKPTPQVDVPVSLPSLLMLSSLTSAAAVLHHSRWSRGRAHVHGLDVLTASILLLAQ